MLGHTVPRSPSNAVGLRSGPLRVLTAAGRFKMAMEAIETGVDIRETSLAKKARAGSCAPALYSQLKERFEDDVCQPPEYDEMSAGMDSSRMTMDDLMASGHKGNGRAQDDGHSSASSSFVFDTSAAAKGLFDEVDAFHSSGGAALMTLAGADPVEMEPMTMTDHHESGNPLALAASGLGRGHFSNKSEEGGSNDENSYAAVTARLAALGIDCQQVFFSSSSFDGSGDDYADDEDGNDSLLSAETRDSGSLVDKAGTFDHEKAAEALLASAAASAAASAKKKGSRTGGTGGTAAFALPVKQTKSKTSVELTATGTGGNAAAGAVFTSSLRERLASAAKKASSSSSPSSASIAYRVTSAFGKTRVEKYRLALPLPAALPPHLPPSSTAAASASSSGGLGKAKSKGKVAAAAAQPMRSPIHLPFSSSSSAYRRSRRQQEEEEDGPVFGQHGLPSLARPFTAGGAAAAHPHNDEEEEREQGEASEGAGMLKTMGSPFPVRRLMWEDQQEEEEEEEEGEDSAAAFFVPSSGFVDGDALTEASFDPPEGEDDEEGQGEEGEGDGASSLFSADDRSIGSADRITRSSRKAQNLLLDHHHHHHHHHHAASSAAAPAPASASASPYPRFGVPLSERKHKARPSGDADPVSRYQQFDQQRKKQHELVNRSIEKSAAMQSAQRKVKMAMAASPAKTTTAMTAGATPSKALMASPSSSSYELTQIPPSWLMLQLQQHQQQQQADQSFELVQGAVAGAGAGAGGGFGDYTYAGSGLSYAAYGEEEEEEEEQEQEQEDGAHEYRYEHEWERHADWMASDVALASIKTPQPQPQPQPYYREFPLAAAGAGAGGDDDDDDGFFYDAAAVTASLAQQLILLGSCNSSKQQEEEMRREVAEVSALLQQLTATASPATTKATSSPRHHQRVADSWLLGSSSSSSSSPPQADDDYEGCRGTPARPSKAPSSRLTAHAAAVDGSPFSFSSPSSSSSFVDYREDLPIDCLGPPALGALPLAPTEEVALTRSVYEAEVAEEHGGSRSRFYSY